MARAAPRAGWLALLALLAFRGSAIPASPRIYHDVLPGEVDIIITLCFTDLFQGIWALVRGLTGIRDAVLVCEEKGKSDAANMACAGSIFDLLSDLSEAVSYLSATGSDCTTHLNDKAYCSGDISAMTSAVFDFANFAMDVNASCKGVPAAEESASHKGRTLLEEAPSGKKGRGLAGLLPKTNHFQRARVEKRTFSEILASMPSDSMDLQAQDLNATARSLDDNLSPERAVDLSLCVSEIGMGLGGLIRAGVAINEARKLCTAEKLKKKHGDRVCTVDLMGSIGSLSMAARFFSESAVHCPLKDNLAAACVGDAMELVTAITSIIAASVAMPLTCKPFERHYDEGIAPDRRLGAGVNDSLATFV